MISTIKHTTFQSNHCGDISNTSNFEPRLGKRHFFWEKCIQAKEWGNSVVVSLTAWGLFCVTLSTNARLNVKNCLEVLVSVRQKSHHGNWIASFFLKPDSSTMGPNKSNHILITRIREGRSWNCYVSYAFVVYPNINCFIQQKKMIKCLWSASTEASTHISTPYCMWNAPRNTFYKTETCQSWTLKFINWRFTYNHVHCKIFIFPASTGQYPWWKKNRCL